MLMQALPRLPALAHHFSSRTRRCLNPHFARNAASVATQQDVNDTLQQLCHQYGITAAVQVAAGTWGLGLFTQPSQQSPAHAHSRGHTHIENLSTHIQQQDSCEAHNEQHDSQPQHWVETPQQEHLHQQQAADELLVSVPLQLVLSSSIPGCSPNLQTAPGALQELLQHPKISQHWELQIAVLLLWTLKQASHSTVSSFWQTYASTFIPTYHQQAGLLLWSASELQELQDPELQQTAMTWQQTVQDAYRTAVQPAFTSMAATGHLTHHCSSSNDGPSCSGQVCTVEEWMWAVAAVESRAFGLPKGNIPISSAAGSKATAMPDYSSGNRSDNSGSIGKGSSNAGGSDADLLSAQRTAGQQLVGLVPVLDLANHTCRSDCHHSIDGEAATFNLYISSSSITSSSSSGSVVQRGISNQPGGELLITYGKKDNRQLIDQYGFIVPANPFDRVQFFPEQRTAPQQQQLWMSHTAVKQAGQQMKQQLQQQVLSKDDKDIAISRVDAAVASIIAAAGWKNLRQYKAVTAGSTSARAMQLLADVKMQLMSSATTITEDHNLLQRVQKRVGEYAYQSSALLSAGQQVSPKAAAQRDGQTAAERRLLAAVQYRINRKQLIEAAGLVLEAIVAEQTARLVVDL